MQPSGQRGEAWFTGLYTAHHAEVVRYGLRRLAGRDAAMELAQDVFVIAWRRRGQVPDRSLPWLYGVARRVLANQWRRRRPDPVALPLLDPDALVADRDVTEADGVSAVVDLRAALATLGDADQEILRLIGWEQLTIAEAAVVLECGRSAAAVRLHRARRRLAAAMVTTAPASVPSPTVTRS